MRCWETADKVAQCPRTPAAVDTDRTGRVQDADADAVAGRKASADQSLSIGGVGLTAVALRAGLVEEVAPVVHRVAVGGGPAALLRDLRLDLDLVGERRLLSAALHRASPALTTQRHAR